jgi:hypothetical protein
VCALQMDAEEQAERDEEEERRHKGRRGGDDEEGGDEDAYEADQRAMTKRQKVRKALLGATESASVKKADVVGKAAKRLAQRKARGADEDAEGPTKAPAAGEKKGKKNKGVDAEEARWGREQEAVMRELERRPTDGGGAPARRKAKVVLQDSAGFDGEGEGSGAKEKKKKKGDKEDKDAEGGKSTGPYGFTEFDPMRIRLKKNKKADRTGSFKSKARFKLRTKRR